MSAVGRIFKEIERLSRGNKFEDGDRPFSLNVRLSNGRLLENHDYYSVNISSGYVELCEPIIVEKPLSDENRRIFVPLDSIISVQPIWL